MNSLSAIACARAIGLPLEQILIGLLSFTGTHRRFESREKSAKSSSSMIMLITQQRFWLPLRRQEDIITMSSGWFSSHIPTQEPRLSFHSLPKFYPKPIMSYWPTFLRHGNRTPGWFLPDIFRLLQQAGTDVHYFRPLPKSKIFLSNISGHDLLITMGAGNGVNIGEELLASAKK